MKNPWVNLPVEAPFILPDDQAFIYGYNKKQTEPYQIHHELLPQPYAGSPKHATVYLLNLNPGFSATDKYFEYSLPGYKKAIRNSLVFKNQTSFYFLDARFKTTPAYAWWYSHLKQVIDVWGMQKTTKQIMVVEFFPYHSKSFKNSKLLKSTAQEFAFELVRKAMEVNKSIILMRSFKLWLATLPELENYKFLYKLKNPQNPCITAGNMWNDDFFKIFSP